MKKEMYEYRGSTYCRVTVPVIGDLENMKHEVRISDNEDVELHMGTSLVNYLNGHDTQKMMISEISDAVRARFDSVSSKLIRCTNNADELDLIASGEISPSSNYRDGYRERGLSVSSEWSYAAGGEYKYVYFISGTVIGHGSDDEPLLDVDTVKAESKMYNADEFYNEFVSAGKASAKAYRAAHGWSEEAFGALVSGLSSAIRLERVD